MSTKQAKTTGGGDAGTRGKLDALVGGRPGAVAVYANVHRIGPEWLVCFDGRSSLEGVPLDDAMRAIGHAQAELLRVAVDVGTAAGLTPRWAIARAKAAAAEALALRGDLR